MAGGKLQPPRPVLQRASSPGGAKGLLNTGDLGREPVHGAKSTDCRIGRDDIAVAHGGSDGSGETLNMILVSGLGAYEHESVHRFYRRETPAEGGDHRPQQRVGHAIIHPRKLGDDIFGGAVDQARCLAGEVGTGGCDYGADRLGAGGD